MDWRAGARVTGAAGLLLLLVTPAWSQPAAPAGRVKTTAGTAVIVHEGRESPARPGQPVYEQDVVRTGAGGRLGLTLKDGSRLSLGANSELQLRAFAYSPAQHQLALAVRVLKGVAAYVSGRIAELSPDSVKIETPTSIIGVRGTHVVVAVDRP